MLSCLNGCQNLPDSDKHLFSVNMSKHSMLSFHLSQFCLDPALLTFHHCIVPPLKQFYGHPSPTQNCLPKIIRK